VDASPPFRTLTPDEYDRLPLEQQIAYTRELLVHVRARMEETRAQMARTKAIMDKSRM